MPRPFRIAAFAALLLVGLLLSACQQVAPPDPLITPSSVPAETLAPGETAQPGDPTLPPPTDQPERTLVICLAQEPETLYPYGGSSPAQQVILEALYDGPIDSRSYSYQPVILEKLPSLADGDATLVAVDVVAGDKVVGDDGEVYELAAGVKVRPAGCNAPDCAIEWDGTSALQMDQLSANFKLLPGLTWSDGTPLTAKDSVYAFGLVMDPDTTTVKYVGDRTASYEAADDVTIVWTGLPSNPCGPTAMSLPNGRSPPSASTTTSSTSRCPCRAASRCGRARRG